MVGPWWRAYCLPRTSRTSETRATSSRQANAVGGHIAGRVDLGGRCHYTKGIPMRRKKTQRVLAGTSGLLALSIALPGAAQAQDANAQSPETLDEVVVTGIIGSLQRNLDLKRAAPGVVDVITSEDIGKFPDSNVAASLQRVP